MFLYKYKVHAVCRVPVIVPLFRLRFLEKYLIKNVENTMSEPLEPPPPLPTPLRKQSRLYCGCSSLLLAVPRITIFVEKTDETRRPQVHVERFMFPLPTTTDSLSAPLKGLYYENTAILGQFCAEVFNKKIHDCLLEILLQTDGSPDLHTFFGQMK